MPNRLQIRVTLLSLAASFVAVSCTPDNPPPPKSDLNLSAVLPKGIQAVQPGDTSVVMSSPNIQIQQDAINPLTGQASPRANSQTGAPLNVTATVGAPVKPTPPQPKEEIVIPPKDAKWTIFCTVISGPGHTTRAKDLKKSLAAATGSSKWYVIHDDEKSTIYYGFYRTIERGTRDGAAAQSDKATIASLRDPTGEAPLQLCTFIQIDKPAPEAPVEWDLGRIGRSPAHYWSLQVAAYTADATDPDGHDRKWAAVESVKELRGQGIPAYFYHGGAVSSVCIGAWPENAVKRQDGADKWGDASANNASQPIFVTNGPLPPGLTPLDPNGGKLRTLAPRVEIVDDSMHAMITRFPSHAMNGIDRQHQMKNPKTGEMEMTREPSFLVLVPEVKASENLPNARNVVTDPHPSQSLPPSLLGLEPTRTAPQPGTGHLRSVGE